jgi:diguanylate cyclase (GGDEF)-like protein
LSEPRSLPRILFEIGKVIGSATDPGSLLAEVSQLVTELVGADACSIMLLDDSKTVLLGKAAYGLERERIDSISFRVGEGVAGWVAERGEPAVIADVTADERFVALPDSSHRIRSLVCVPLLARDRPVGVMTATAATPDVFDDGDVDLLVFVATTMALDMENLRLRRLAITDALTGAYNREYLARRLPEEINRCRRSEEPLSVAMVDIDHFKSVNDEHGHAVGDEVLAAVVERMRASIRSADTLIRYGGEEFLLLLPGSDLEEARAIAERMRESFEEQPVEVEDHALEIRVSIGVAELGDDDAERAVVKRADEALYAAKAAGRNRVV